jgi:glycosyltransferase involved in cell wall biosynthesis
VHKILFLVQLPPPIHGASAVNQSIKNSSLINEYFRTEFFNISPAKDLSDIGKMNVGKFFSIVKIFIGSVYLYLKFKPKLVYITLSPHGLAFYKDGLIAIILKMLGGRIVFHLHGKGIAGVTKRSWIKRLIYRAVFKNVEIIHLSDKLFYDLDNVRDISTSITAVPNGIDDSSYYFTVDKSPIFTFVYLSNLVRAKGADTLIRATALVNKKYAGLFEVKIIGKTSNAAYLQELHDLITEDLAKTIKIVGPKYDLEKILELKKSNVFVLPTKNDCFPLSILEAMAAGLAVISTDEGAITDIIDHGETGDVIPDSSPISLAAAMVKHIENRQYNENCATAAHKKFLLNYTQLIFEQRFVASLNNIIGRK